MKGERKSNTQAKKCCNGKIECRKEGTVIAKQSGSDKGRRGVGYERENEN